MSQDQSGCPTCQTQEAGLPTPGYPHTKGCPQIRARALAESILCWNDPGWSTGWSTEPAARERNRVFQRTLRLCVDALTAERSDALKGQAEPAGISERARRLWPKLDIGQSYEANLALLQAALDAHAREAVTAERTRLRPILKATGELVAMSDQAKSTPNSPHTKDCGNECACFSRGLSATLRVRCLKHYGVPALNTTATGAECGACVLNPERDAVPDHFRCMPQMVISRRLFQACEAGSRCRRTGDRAMTA